MRYERYYRDEQGNWQVETVTEDQRTVDDARRERIAMIWDRARLALTGRLETRGYDRQSAEALAAVLLFQELPAGERSAVQALAADIATRAVQRVQQVRQANTNITIDTIDP